MLFWQTGTVNVTDTQKGQGHILHIGKVTSGHMETGQYVILYVDKVCIIFISVFLPNIKILCLWKDHLLIKKKNYNKKKI